MRPKKENRIIFDHKRDGYHFGHCLNEDHDNYYCNVKFKGDTVGKHQIMYCKECEGVLVNRDITYFHLGDMKQKKRMEKKL